MKRWLSLLAVLWSPLALAVQGLQLSPIGVELKPGEQAAAITVINHDPVAHVLQVEVRRWRQRGAEQTLTPASRLLASPPLFQLAPGASQIVRFGFPEGLPAASVERAWRLFFTEVPGRQTAPPKAGAIRILLRLSVPVFQAPARSDDALLWSRSASGLR
jgi:P pilus assembly protein, chaperone PapD